MRILHNSMAFTFSNLQVQFQAGHGHKHPFLVIEQGEHKIHTKAGTNLFIDVCALSAAFLI